MYPGKDKLLGSICHAIMIPVLGLHFFCFFLWFFFLGRGDKRFDFKLNYENMLKAINWPGSFVITLENRP